MPGAATEWERGWRTIASSTLGIVFMTAVPSVTGIVMAPLMAQFGWSRALIASNVMICAILSLVLAPVAGRYIVRFGVRRCALTSVIATVPGLLLIAIAGGHPLTWIAVWLVYGTIAVGISPLMWSTAIAQLFDRTRGVALAIALCGSGVAYFLFPPFAALLVQHFGWRGVYVGFAALMLVLLLPVTILWFRGRDDLNISLSSPSDGAPATGMLFADVLRARQFWQLALLSMLIALGEGALTVHLFPILREGGLSPASAVWVTALMGIALIVGRLLTGFLLDRLSAPLVMAGSTALILVGCLIAEFSIGSIMGGTAFSLLLGLGAGGTTNALAYLTSRYFGLSAYATVFGLLMGMFSVGYGVGPVITGYVREIAQSYDPIFLWLAGALAIACLLTLALGRPVSADVSSSTARH